MKKLLIVIFGILLMISCTDKKKEQEEKQKIEAAIKKIDSIDNEVKAGIDKLNEATKKFEKQLQELDSII